MRWGRRALAATIAVLLSMGAVGDRPVMAAAPDTYQQGDPIAKFDWITGWAGLLVGYNGPVYAYYNANDSISVKSVFGLAYECVELPQRYWYLKRWVTSRTWGADAFEMAGHIPTDSSRKPEALWYKQANSPETAPVAGDILVFGQVTGSWPRGHVALVTSVSSTKVTFIEQNLRVGHQDSGPPVALDQLALTRKGSGPSATYSVGSISLLAAARTYPAVLGWLHAVKNTVGTTPAAAELVAPKSYMGRFGTTGAMGTPREAPIATLLADGRVLMTGGSDARAVLRSAELYDPHTRRFAGTASMSTSRVLHTATLLGNGRVLIAGGANLTRDLASAEIYDPRGGTFTSTHPMTTRRQDQTATLLLDGRVLVVGGWHSGNGGNVALRSAELYDPKAGTFGPTGSLSAGRESQTATLLANGEVLIAGGTDGSNALASAELYDARTGSFNATGSMLQARYGHTATLLPDGRVLIAGGTDGRNALAGAELYDPRSGSFTQTASLATARYGHVAALLRDGRVLIAGGVRYLSRKWTVLASAELFDWRTGKFEPGPAMSVPRYNSTASVLAGGLVLIAGGANSVTGTKTLATADLYR